METLLAVGTLAIGMVFVAGTFLAAVYLSTLSTERTIAAVVADEAFAKIRLYGLDPNHSSLKTDGYTLHDQLVTVPADEYLYPSTSTSIDKQYCWAALCRRVGPDSRLVEFTVFVCRRSGSATRYWTDLTDATGLRPLPVRIGIGPATGLGAESEAVINDAAGVAFVSDGAMLVVDGTGEIYRVLERYASPPDRIRLDRRRTDLALSAGASVWVVPLPKLGGRDPLVAIYQKVIRF